MLAVVLLFLLTSVRAQNAWANNELQWGTSERMSEPFSPALASIWAFLDIVKNYAESMSPSSQWKWLTPYIQEVVEKIENAMWSSESVSERPSEKKPSGICLTPGCRKAADQVLANMNKDVDPCDNFYEFACGNFIKKTKVPGYKAIVNQISITEHEVAHQIKMILEEPPKYNEGRAARIAKDFYKTCMDKTKIEKIGLSHIKKILKRMGGWPVLEGDQWDASKFTWKDTVYKFKDEGFGIGYLIEFRVGIDLKNNSNYIIQLDHPALSIGRQHLVKGMEDERVQALYRLMVDIAVIFGADHKRAAKELKDSLDFEILLAKISTPDEGRRMTIPQLKYNFPSIPWAEYISTILPKSISVRRDEVFIMKGIPYIKRLENLLSTTPKRIQANYMFWRAVLFSVPYLTEELRQRNLEFNSVLFSITEQEPRWKECATITGESFDVAVSSLYVQRFFTRIQKAKRSTLEMLKNIREEMIKTLKTVDWMDYETRKNALEKIEAMTSFIGYSKEMLDYRTVEDYYQKFEFTQGKFLEAKLNHNKFKLDFLNSLLRKYISKSDWILHEVLKVGAEYSNQLNYIGVPAGILQGVYFSQDRPNYMNYGAIGYVIGHEMTHGFDDQGRLFDKDGGLFDWWDSESKKTFRRKAECMVYQYGNYTVEHFGMKLNGKFTLGENIADNGGIKHAYLAYNSWVEKHRTEKRLPGLQNYTPQQMFWISAANSYCEKHKPEAPRSVIMEDNHSPGEFRVRGPFSNRPEFAKDFKCPTGSKMNPSKKCQVW